MLQIEPVTLDSKAAASPWRYDVDVDGDGDGDGDGGVDVDVDVDVDDDNDDDVDVDAVHASSLVYVLYACQDIFPSSCRCACSSSKRSACRRLARREHYSFFIAVLFCSVSFCSASFSALFAFICSTLL